ncbi:uncharacterized protein LOC142106610 [Mixophyes fleayi]|uniref:uncharacterized protein LOC142106610 n=1 Tax=Mixophyes fleayi TaxID=3061075 RepID=UPI003F4E32E8
MPQIHFLGYIVSGAGLQMDPVKLSEILKWSRLMGLKANQRFIGFANYYQQFIPQFSSIITSITAQIRKSANPQDWSPEAVSAFEVLKKAFSSASVLAQPDQNKPFLVEVDASAVGVGQFCCKSLFLGNYYPAVSSLGGSPPLSLTTALGIKNYSQ